MKDKRTMNPKQIQKTERHITALPREIDRNLAITLGEMVVAFGRLEDMFKVAIKRLENDRKLDQVVNAFSGMRGSLRSLISHCRDHFPILSDHCVKAEQLNTDRQDFIHATFAATDEGQYVRFRKLVAYGDLESDVEQIRRITEKANSLIEELDQATGSLITDPKKAGEIIATVSAPTISRS
jgi:uncharacterized glyoxalase superfamily metalloenzyme YdcJ